MYIIVQIFLGVVGSILSYFLMKYTKVVAQCNEKLSEETQRLREIAEASWYDKEFVDYLSDKYCDSIEGWPSSSSAFWWESSPPKEERPKILRMYCRQIILERLFPRTKSIEVEIITRLEKEGFKIKKKNQSKTEGQNEN